jgi:hypothetical protein
VKAELGLPLPLLLGGDESLALTAPPYCLPPCVMLASLSLWDTIWTLNRPSCEPRNPFLSKLVASAIVIRSGRTHSLCSNPISP